MNIDIKTVLLKSLSSNKTIRGSHRLHFGKSCFIIKYEVKGKFLNITHVRKTVRKPLTWRQCLQQKCRLKKLYQLKARNKRHKQKVTAARDRQRQIMSLQVTETQTLFIDDVILQTKEIQTMESQIPPKKMSATTETENISLTTSAQQTIASTRYQLKRLTDGQAQSQKSFTPNATKSCQTELNSETKGIQCKRNTFGKATQTDVDVLKSSYTQVWKDSVESTPTPTIALANLPEKEVVVYMLNEIGELVLNQNQILNNNTKMLGQISEMTMLTKMVNLGKAWSKRRFKKNNKRYHHKPYNKRELLEVKTFERNPTKEILDERHKSIQTERIVKPEMFQKSTQTTIKPRKLSFLRKRNIRSLN